MRKSLFVESILLSSLTFLWMGAAYAQQPAAEPKPPVSLSPAVPVVATPPTDPAKMAQPAGTIPAPQVDAATFVIGAEDQLSITMWDQPGLSGTFVVRPDGKFALPLLGEIQATGLTPVELGKAIEKLALEQLTSPHCTVNVVGVHSKRVYFDGEGIKQPGEMDLGIPIHLLEAISARGGFTDFASKNKIKILRGGKPLTIVNGNSKSIYIRYKDLVDGKHPNSNVELKDGDHVFIP